MRGGRYEQRKGDGNVRNAETLLQSRSVAEVREVEAATRREIQDKQEELRQLVGASYRDLILSADSIRIMASCCDCIMANLASMTHGLNTISVTISSAPPASSTAAGGGSSGGELYAVGSRVKYLVDTPEKIWGCLDDHLYLEAAQRYLRARHVHTLLLRTNAAATHFPLLRHHSPLLDTFHAHISARARDRLQDTALHPPDYALALAAMAIVDHLSSPTLFALFLDTRKAWLRSFFQRAHSSSASPSDLLCSALDLIHLTLCHIAHLFLDLPAGAPPLLFATILSTPPSSHLFGGILNPDDEVAAWKLHRDQLEASMAPLSAEFVAEASLSFLSLCAQELAVETKPVFWALLSGKQLADLEDAVRLHLHKQAVLHHSLAWLHDAFGRVVSSPWEFLSTLLLRRSVNLWESLFETVFVGRVKAIVDSHVNAISILHMVDARLKETSACLDQPPLGLPRSLVAENGGHFSTRKREWLGEVSLYLGPDVCRIQEVVDQGLKTVLQDMLLSLGTAPQRFSSRIAELAPFMQGRVVSCMSKMCKELQVRLNELSQCLEGSTSAPDGLVNVERALFLGRLALSLGQHLRYLPVILGPSERWLDDSGSSDSSPGDVAAHPLARRNSWSDRRDAKSLIGLWSPKADQTSQLLSRIQAELSGHWDVAHNLWVTWSTDMLVQMFSRDLNGDDSFFATTLSKGWEETVIKQDNAEVEIKITLPATASPSAAGLLLVANQEIYRVGGHVLDKALVHLFATRLLEKVLSTYDSFVANLSITERGSLQLLFDVKFVANVLSGLQEEQERRKSESGVKVRTLLSTLSSKLDPIDWATYEAQLWENEQRSYQRCAVLFGFLTQLNRLHAELGVNQSSTAITMDLSTSERLRFGTLPISMPVLGGDSGAASNRGEADEGRKGSVADDEERFAFDDESRGLTSLPSLKSLMGQVGSKIGEGTLKFGSSIIGDGQVGRLRDTAISTFGEMLPSLDAWNS